jgi:alkylhydroperoxidase family enzyme
MSRMTPVYKPGDHPDAADPVVAQRLADLFEHMMPGVKDPEIDRAHGGFAVVARDPRLAMHLIRLSDHIVKDMPWTSQRRDLRELAIQTLNFHFLCEYSYRAHVPTAEKYGISAEQLSAIPYWQTTPLFTDVQRLVVEYTLATVKGEVSDALFSRVVKAFGETETVEFTTAVAWWSFWAMIINATQPEITAS